MKLILKTLCVAIVLLFFIGFPYITADTVTVTVTGKERVNSKNASKYLVFTDSETFENTDCLRRFKFNSSDLYGKIKEDKQYTFVVYGWRIPIFSSYRNIVRVKSKSRK